MTRAKNFLIEIVEDDVQLINSNSTLRNRSKNESKLFKAGCLLTSTVQCKAINIFKEKLEIRKKYKVKDMERTRIYYL